MRIASGPACSGSTGSESPRKPEASDCSRASIQPGDQPVVVVAAGDEHLGLRAQRGARLAQEALRVRGRVAMRGLAQLQPVAEDDEPVRRRAARSISGARSSGRRSRSLPLAAPRWRSETTRVRTRLVCRGDGPARRHPRRRLLARARRPARRDAPRRPRRGRDQGRAAGRRRRHARTGGRRGARARPPTTSGSTATSARWRSTSARRRTSRSRASSPPAPTCSSSRSVPA